MVRLINSRIFNNGGDGVNVMAGRAEIINCESTGNRGAGYRIASDADARIVGSTARDNGEDGFVIEHRNEFTAIAGSFTEAEREEVRQLLTAAKTEEDKLNVLRAHKRLGPIALKMLDAGAAVATIAQFAMQLFGG